MERAEFCAGRPAFIAAQGAAGGEAPLILIEGRGVGIDDGFVLQGEGGFRSDAVFAIEIGTPAFHPVEAVAGAERTGIPTAFFAHPGGRLGCAGQAGAGENDGRDPPHGHHPREKIPQGEALN